MREAVVRGAGLGLTVLYALFIGWLFVRQPSTLAEVTGTLSSAAGIYHIDQQAFEDGLRYFRNDQFVEARAAFARADPALRDALTQFYVAYAFYRQGWGRLYSDDALYRDGLEAIERAIALAPDSAEAYNNLAGVLKIEDRIAEAVGYFVSENPITTSTAPSDKGGSNVR